MTWRWASRHFSRAARCLTRSASRSASRPVSSPISLRLCSWAASASAVSLSNSFFFASSSAVRVICSVFPASSGWPGGWLFPFPRCGAGSGWRGVVHAVWLRRRRPPVAGRSAERWQSRTKASRAIRRENRRRRTASGDMAGTGESRSGSKLRPQVELEEVGLQRRAGDLIRAHPLKTERDLWREGDGGADDEALRHWCRRRRTRNR